MLVRKSVQLSAACLVQSIPCDEKVMTAEFTIVVSEGAPDRLIVSIRNSLPR